MGRRGTEKRAMQCEVLVRVDDELAHQLKRAASAAGSTQAALIRSLLWAHFNGSAPQPMRTTAPANAELCSALAAVGTHVGRLTGILVQLAKSVRESGGSAVLRADIENTRIEAMSALASIRDLLMELKK